MGGRGIEARCIIYTAKLVKTQCRNYAEHDNKQLARNSGWKQGNISVAIVVDARLFCIIQTCFGSRPTCLFMECIRAQHKSRATWPTFLSFSLFVTRGSCCQFSNWLFEREYAPRSFRIIYKCSLRAHISYDLTDDDNGLTACVHAQVTNLLPHLAFTSMPYRIAGEPKKLARDNGNHNLSV